MNKLSDFSKIIFDSIAEYNDKLKLFISTMLNLLINAKENYNTLLYGFIRNEQLYDRKCLIQHPLTELCPKIHKEHWTIDQINLQKFMTNEIN